VVDRWIDGCYFHLVLLYFLFIIIRNKGKIVIYGELSLVNR